MLLLGVVAIVVALLLLLLLLRIPFEWGGDHESYKAL
jgi:hypothetical protein